MRVKYLALARYSELNPVDGSCVVVGFDPERIIVPSFPAVFGYVHILVKLIIPKVYAGVERTFRLEILDAEQKGVVEPVTGILAFPPVPEGRMQLAMMMNLNVPGPIFPEAGWYSLVLHVGEDVVAENPFRIELVEAPPESGGPLPDAFDGYRSGVVR